MTTLTQEQADIVKSKPTREQVELLFDIINEGKDSLITNKDIIKSNFPEMFHYLTMEFVKSMSYVYELSLTDIENFSDEEGKAYIKNKIIDNVTSQL